MDQQIHAPAAAADMQVVFFDFQLNRCILIIHGRHAHTIACIPVHVVSEDARQNGKLRENEQQDEKTDGHVCEANFQFKGCQQVHRRQVAKV